ncbi:MAG: NAD(P)H-hydrate dehydratase, partial [Nanobdellota archaeon]
GENGRILVIGGSEDYTGAPFLAAMGALRSGADLVKVVCPEKVAWTINSLSPDIITIKLKGKNITEQNLERIKEEMEKNDVILIGPGLGNDKGTKDIIKEIVYNNKNKVIDADALKGLDLKHIRDSILTPHKKEYESINNRESLNDNVIILKGKEDKIITRDRTYRNNTGNEGMTVGGTGDVLAGMAAGFMSQGKSKLSSARKAAWLNGKIGDMLYQKYDFGFLASDFIKGMKFTADTVLIKKIEGRDKVLMIKRRYPPFRDHYALPGGHIEMHETAEEAAKRELEEETGIKAHNPKQVGTYSDPNRDPRGRYVTVAFRAKSRSYKTKAGSDAKEAEWINIKELDKLDLAFDHRKIIRDAIRLPRQG